MSICHVHPSFATFCRINSLNTKGPNNRARVSFTMLFVKLFDSRIISHICQCSEVGHWCGSVVHDDFGGLEVTKFDVFFSLCWRLCIASFPILDRFSETYNLLVCTAGFLFCPGLNCIPCIGVSNVARANRGVEIHNFHLFVAFDASHHLPHHCFHCLHCFVHKPSDNSHCFVNIFELKVAILGRMALFQCTVCFNECNTFFQLLLRLSQLCPRPSCCQLLAATCYWSDPPFQGSHFDLFMHHCTQCGNCSRTHFDLRNRIICLRNQNFGNHGGTGMHFAPRICCSVGGSCRSSSFCTSASKSMRSVTCKNSCSKSVVKSCQLAPLFVVSPMVVAVW